jgi:Fe-S-cluster containining protein
MNTACEICKGACCESIIVKAPEGDEGRWLTLHGQALGFGRVQLETPCAKLCGGKCSIWKDRPLLCQAYPVGGDNCRETVKRRRANWAEIFAAMPEPLTDPQ